MRCERPHDDFDFDALSNTYNFERTSHRARVFTRLVIRECQRQPARTARVLDIGCGRGIELASAYQWAIRQHAGEYWGIEPDQGIVTPPGLFDVVRPSTFEATSLPPSHFDVAYAFMVMEHVDDPARFMHALADCLKPGGVFLFATPNRRHYFTRLAAGLHAVRMDELVLRAVRRQEAESYHYPVRYRFNDEKTIERLATTCGFEPPRFAYLEELGPRGYFPRPLRFIFHGLALKRRIIKRRNALITMVGRLSKPAA